MNVRLSDDPERQNALLRSITWVLTKMAASTSWGPDLDWIASDKDGHLGVFTTAGLGAIPTRVTGDPAGLVAVMVDVERLRGFDFEAEGSIQEPARIGAFGFDYAGDRHPGQYIAGRPYHRIGQPPAEPLSVESLGPDAANYLRDVCFPRLCFGDSREIVVEDAFEEIHRPTDWDQWSRPELLHPVAPRPEPPGDEPQSHT